MEKRDFFEEFYSNLNKELNNDSFVNSIEELINKNKFTKNNFLKLIKEEYHE